MIRLPTPKRIWEGHKPSPSDKSKIKAIAKKTEKKGRAK